MSRDQDSGLAETHFRRGGDLLLILKVSTEGLKRDIGLGGGGKVNVPLFCHEDVTDLGVCAVIMIMLLHIYSGIEYDLEGEGTEVRQRQA